MNSAQLLSSYEHCNRAGIWSRDWERARIDFHELLQEGIKEGMTSTRPDFNIAAGERIMEISAQREIVSDQHDLYSQVVHHCAIADIVSYAIRKPSDKPWTVLEPVELPNGEMWHSDAFLAPDGLRLRRVILATSWSDDRHYSEARSWFSLGNVCSYELPMQEAVVIVGQNRGGKRHGYWTHGLRHPVSKQLRFRKKSDRDTPFKASWVEVWREDYDEISTQQWLESMLSDGVLQDVCFSVDIPVPEKSARQRIVDLAAQRLEEIYNTKTLPPQQLSTCDFPIPCIYRSACHSGNSPSGKYGFVKIDQLA